MLATPVAVAMPADINTSNCLSPSRARDNARLRVEALLAEAKIWPIRTLEPGDELLPASMPDRFKPQVIVMDIAVDQNGRISDCRVRQRSSFAVLNNASCELVRTHYVAIQPFRAGSQKIAVDWTSRTLDPQRLACGGNGGTVPVTSSLWVNSNVFAGAGLQNGTVFLALDVGTKGFADRCIVLAADVTPDLQRNVCKMVVQRATIMPAADGSGNLVPARLKMVVQFKK